MTTVSFLPTEADIEILRADPRSITFKFSDPIRDITNDSITFAVYDGIDGTEVFTYTNGIGEHSDPALADGGETAFAVVPTDTDDASPEAKTAWVYEVRVLPQGGVAGTDDFVAFKGKFLISPRPKTIAQP